jgi:predicted Zn-dependent peptidase
VTMMRQTTTSCARRNGAAQIDVLAEVTREFGQLRSCPIIPLAAPRGAGVQPRRVRITTNKPVAAAQLAYGPGLTRRCPEYAALLVMNKILDRFPGGWLEEELRGRGLAYVDRIRTERVDEAILERAKTSALVSEALGVQSNAQRAKTFALDELMGCGFDDMLKLRDAIRSVDGRAVRDAAVRYLQTAREHRAGMR